MCIRDSPYGEAWTLEEGRELVRRASGIHFDPICVEAFLENWNTDPTPFVWTKSSRTIVRDHRRMLARISRAEH